MRLKSLLYRGAEADVFLGRWCGRPAVFKRRKAMPYRLPALDRAIRAQRTVREAEMVHRSKAVGVPSPLLYFVDPKHSTLVMEYVEGPRLKDLLDAPAAEPSALFEELGRDVARLHMAGIMHGDLTTSNVVLREGSLVFLDFGLSASTYRLEDRAVDLRLIKETVAGAHPAVAAPSMRALMEGYGSEAGAPALKAVSRQLADIERRGRYARVE